MYDNTIEPHTNKSKLRSKPLSGIIDIFSQTIKVAHHVIFTPFYDTKAKRFQSKLRFICFKLCSFQIYLDTSLSFSFFFLHITIISVTNFLKAIYPLGPQFRKVVFSLGYRKPSLFSSYHNEERKWNILNNENKLIFSIHLLFTPDFWQISEFQI